MNWENLKATLLAELADRIDRRAEADKRDSLHNLASAFYRRFPAEDLRGRSPENLYGCLYGLLRFMRRFEADEGPRVRIFNPQLDRHGWESSATVVAILCRDMPFCTASVRGEINQRQLPIHTLASCNLVTRRDDDGGLEAVLPPGAEAPAGASAESLLYFEIGRHSDVAELEPLRQALEDILGEVARVVDDFTPMRERLSVAAADVAAAGCVDREEREEARAFLDWLKHDHVTFLGYEYLAVSRAGAGYEVESRADTHLGILRERETRGPRDLAEDLATTAPAALHDSVLSFGKSRRRSRVHRQAYPDYIEVKVFDEGGEVIGQHRFLGLYTAAVYTMNPSLIPVLRRKVDAVLALSGLDTSEHDGRELIRVLELFPRDELFQSSEQALYET
ncbi:MAG TPA: NAD-glutamate dehydrogenase, partial [Halieaceae bacterium]|nr:NAD-glutamate dehydrogenase [Halieaceae bacterium]